MNGNGRSIGWWVAGILAAFMLGGTLPAVGWFIDSFNEPSEEKVELIEQRQQIVLQTLPVIQERIETLEMQMLAIEQLLRAHTADTP